MKKLLAAAGLGLAAAGFRRHRALRDDLAAIPAEYRSPLLMLLATDVTAGSLRFNRMLFGGIRTPAGRGVTVRTQHVGAVPVEVSTPDGTRVRPGVLYLHGGGMVLGSPKVEAFNSARTARELDAVVVSPDYRLAPEHRYPAALDDCMAALYWMREHAAELGIDAERIAVTGSSAGGGLAAAVAQRAYDEGIRLRAQTLYYPMLDDRTVLRDTGHRGRFAWTTGSNRFGWTSYLGHPPRESDAPQYAAPARREDLAGLAPAWIGVGELDLFHDESVDYAERLQAAGVPCELLTVPGMYHGADALAAKTAAMQEFRRAGSQHLRTHLAPDHT